NRLCLTRLLQKLECLPATLLPQVGRPVMDNFCQSRRTLRFFRCWAPSMEVTASPPSHCRICRIARPCTQVREPDYRSGFLGSRAEVRRLPCCKPSCPRTIT